MRDLRELATVRTASKSDAALRYAELGLPVFPCHSLRARDGRCTCNSFCQHPGKHPVDMPLHMRATANVSVVRGWWQRWPFANVAAPVGKRTGVCILDIDLPCGIRSIRELEDSGSLPPPELIAKSGGGGLHYYYGYTRAHSAFASGFPNVPSGWVAWDVKLVADIPNPNCGVYVLLPPSTTVGRYQWV